ncbi:hypothetical protein MMC32_001797 [Xylographa parallela]|nr:hypothetical protein [Xylographa parallela]
MSSPTPTAKRRKTSALFKPFKSPLKTPLQATSAPGATIANENHHPSPLSITTNSSAKPSAPLPLADNPPLSNTPTTKRTTSPAVPFTTASPTSTSPTSTSISLPALLSRHTSLTMTHTRLLSTLDTHTQALKIESSAKDAELARLIALWRLAARQAAEEIFAGVRDRVNRMGGVGAWREREREGRERWGGGGGWDDGGEKREGGGEEGEEEGVEERREREGGEESDRREERVRREGKERDDDGFTMDMMLKSLSIELGVIGYDKEMQRWID